MEISTPGRICIFGEHQDYLGLPVIAMAISLRARIKGTKRSDNQVIIHKPDLNEIETFSLDDLLYTKPRDYFKSGINICHRDGLTFSSGFECELLSEIPIRSGTSSSSAINVSWIHFLSKMADEPVDMDQQKIGELAYMAEVAEFNEPGGMMDQYTAAMGHLIYLESEPAISIRSLKTNFGIYADRVGAGKTLAMVSHVATSDPPRKKCDIPLNNTGLVFITISIFAFTHCLTATIFFPFIYRTFSNCIMYFHIHKTTTMSTSTIFFIGIWIYFIIKKMRTL